MSDTITIASTLPRFRQLRRSLLFCLLLLLSICSATDSFQQLQYNPRTKQRRSAVSVQTATASINIPPSIYTNGGGATTDTTSSTLGVVIGDRNKRRWVVFRPEKRRNAPEGQQRWRRKQKRKPRVALDDEEYQRRKQKWANRYTTLDGLRATFGSNKNKLYGDLDAPTTRKLYKSLLPTAVCELVLDLEVRPEELAQLAFEARKAAKLYARERCHVPARLLANWYDGFRAFRRYGRFQTDGMSYDQLFDKYYQRSALERSLSLSQKRTEQSEVTRNRKRTKKNDNGSDSRNEWTEEDIVTQTCVKILESACRTNAMIDRMTLPDNKKDRRTRSINKNNAFSEREDLEKVARTLEDDVRKLLDPYNNSWSDRV
mmetsp:Transcript_20777/g.43518  ORF Transcript_20777/g.43518 Transcript_20777/m.43518 type:complete len:373 (-) Transcript_20777:1211-2329(-)